MISEGKGENKKTAPWQDKGKGGLALHKKLQLSASAAGAAAGIVNGLLGAGGGMVLLPLLSRIRELTDSQAFACSVCVMLPISAVSAAVYFLRGGGFPPQTLPYLIGGALGGILAGVLLRRVKAVWLHRLLGLFVLWGALRLLLQ